MRWESEAIAITPPTGSDQALDGTGALDNGRAQSIAFTTASGAAVQIVASGWVTFTADQNVQLRFWRDSTANANQASDFPLWQFAYMNWVCDGYLWVRAKGMTSSGTLYYAPSSR